MWKILVSFGSGLAVGAGAMWAFMSKKFDARFEKIESDIQNAYKARESDAVKNLIDTIKNGSADDWADNFEKDMTARGFEDALTFGHMIDKYLDDVIDAARKTKEPATEDTEKIKSTPEAAPIQTSNKVDEMMEQAKVLAKEGYRTNYATGIPTADRPITNEPAPDKDIQVIMESEFGQAGEDYDAEELLYYNDEVVADSYENEIINPERFIGDALKHFGDGSNDPDIVYVRNDREKIEYKITRTNTNFTDGDEGLEDD